MEVYSSSVEDQLVDGLSYKLNPGSSYIIDKKSSTFFAQGSNIYTPNGGTRVLRFLLNGDDWLDATNSLRVFFDIANLDRDKPLRVLGGPHTFFRRLRVLAQNVLLEDIDYYARNHQMFDIMRAGHVRENEDGEGQGENRFDSAKFQPLFQSAQNLSTGTVYPYGPIGNFDDEYITIKPGETRTVSLKLLSGILNCHKLIPLKYCPITIELEIVSSINDPIISVNDAALGIVVSGAEPNTSISWQIQQPQIKADMCVLDNALNNEYAALLLSGKSLPINFSTFVCQLQSVSGQTPSLNITRGFSRLKSVFATLDQSSGYAAYASNNTHTPVWKKWWNDFFHPMTFSGGAYDVDFEYNSAQMQLGSKMYPEYPIGSLAEAFYQLRKTMGIETSNFHSMDITPYEYRNHKFVLAFDTEKNLGTAFTGINTKSGSLLTLKLKSSSTNNTYMADTIYVTMHADCILQISDSGIAVFD